MSKSLKESDDLALVEALFAKFGLSVSRFVKSEIRSGSTPDYRVMKGGQLFAYCEVKSPRDTWLDEQLAKVPPGEMAGGARPDPTLNRLSRIIFKAATQLDAVNAKRTHPNILVIVNHDESTTFHDLVETLTGLFHADDGARYATAKKISEGEILELKHHIDVFVFVDAGTGKIRYFLGNSEMRHVIAVCKEFGIDARNARR